MDPMQEDHLTSAFQVLYKEVSGIREHIPIPGTSTKTNHQQCFNVESTMSAQQDWARQWLASPKRQYINGEWLAGESRDLKSINPADGSLLATYPFASVAQTELAIQSANQAFRSGVWSQSNRAYRATILRKIAQLIRDHLEKLATLETLPNGKLYQESLVDDIPTCADIFDYYAGWVDKYYGVTSPVESGFLNYTLQEPVGVCGLIAPWNFPLYQTALKLAPALAMGNTVIVKPSQATPYSALLLIELMDEHLDLPAGVVNLLVTDGKTANSLTTSHDVHKLSFTGSTDIGRMLVHNAASSNLKAVTLELGGKSPCIFFDDTKDLDSAIDRAFTVMFSHKGEKCSEPTRFLIQNTIYDKVLAALIAKAEAVRCGNPFSEESTQGAQCNKAQFENIMNYIDIGKSEATLVCGGEADTSGTNDQGYFIRPTIFSHVDSNCRIAREEIFGPVLVCTPFATDQEAVSIANHTVYGLAAGVYTGDISRAHRLAEKIDAGMVFINRYGCYGLSSPFGGFKESGWGKEMAIHSLSSYTKEKSVWVAFGDT